MKLAAALFVFVSTCAFSQRVEVPHKMQFAGITLTIRDDARREIQKDVDLFTQSPKHFAIKVERARTYFPIIEKVFEEERLPEDFKFLVLQESALIPDAVSVSNAVGFWQFKDFTAIEMGLRVDKLVDERMHIEASSRAAAKYLKKNNMYFNNWVYALQAYQMGAGGVMQSVKDYESGTRHMEITSKTYWYVKKFLAHKIAYEGAVKGSGSVQLITFTNQSKKTLADLAKEFAVSEEELKAYNKWVRTSTIPGDKAYTIIIPTSGTNTQLQEAIAKSSATSQPRKATEHQQQTRVEAKPAVARNDVRTINGIPAMKANASETISAFVKRANVNLSAFLKWNDLSISDKLEEHEFYYLQKKQTRSNANEYVTKAGETLWMVAHKHGVQLRKLQKYNPGLTTNSLKEGTVIYLASKKARSRVPLVVTEIAEVDERSTFNWSANPQASTGAVIMVEPQAVVVAPSTSTSENQSLELPAVTEEVPANSHKVAQGETLYSIAKRYKIGVMDLVNWNNLDLQQGLKTGQLLTVSAPELAEAEPPTPTEPKEITHSVKPSDTLYSIARQYGVTINELMEWNQKKDFTLSVGENLRIMKK